MQRCNLDLHLANLDDLISTLISSFLLRSRSRFQSIVYNKKITTLFLSKLVAVDLWPVGWLVYCYARTSGPWDHKMLKDNSHFNILRLRFVWEFHVEFVWRLIMFNIHKWLIIVISIIKI